MSFAIVAYGHDGEATHMIELIEWGEGTYEVYRHEQPTPGNFQRAPKPLGRLEGRQNATRPELYRDAWDLVARWQQLREEEA